jgi:hypothetical protein
MCVFESGSTSSLNVSGSKEGGSQRGSLRDFTAGATREGITNLRSSLSGAPEVHSPTSAASHTHSALNGKFTILHCWCHVNSPY